MPVQILEYWPFLSTLVSVLIGGAITWAVAKTKLEDLIKSHDLLEKRVGILEREVERDRITMTDRLARIEVMLADVRETCRRFTNT
jgi:putative ubiquitin-RnfH superfamily antitoxin RatB of RatAB toxin-antitoxin module